MRVEVRVFEEGAFWLAEVPALDAMTQGTSKEDALYMAKDMVESLADPPGLSVTVHSRPDGTFELGSDDVPGLVALIRQRQRSSTAVAEGQGGQRGG